MFTFHLDPVDKGTNFDWRISVNNIEVECIKINVIQHSKVIRSFVNKTPDAPLFSIILENEYYDHSLLTNFFQCQDVRLTDENYLFLKELLSELKIDTFNDKIDAFQHLLEEIQKKDTLLRNLYSCKKYLINVIESHECNLPDVVVNCVTMLDNIGDIEFFQIIFSCCVARPDSIDFYIDLIKQIDNQIPLLDQFKHYVEFEYQNSLEIDHFEVQCESRYILTKLSNTFESSQHDDTTSNSTNNNNTQEIIEIIRKDNIDALKAYIFDHNIEDYTTIKYSFNENEKCTILQKDKPTLLEIAAFFGAVKCFKYFLLNNDKVSFILAKYAVAGGNTEIIHICAQNKCIFVHTLNIAVKYHRFKVFNWIVETFKSNLSFSSFLIETAFKYCEIQIIFYLLKNGYFSPDFLIESVKSNNLILYQFFLPMVDINSISSIDGFTSLHAACFNGNLDMVTLILQQPGVEINKIVNSRHSESTALHIACRYRYNLEIIKLLISNGADLNIPNIYFTGRNNSTYNCIHIAVDKNNPELVAYLINECNVDINVEQKREDSNEKNSERNILSEINHFLIEFHPFLNLHHFIWLLKMAILKSLRFYYHMMILM